MWIEDLCLYIEIEFTLIFAIYTRGTQIIYFIGFNKLFHEFCIYILFHFEDSLPDNICLSVFDCTSIYLSIYLFILQYHQLVFMTHLLYSSRSPMLSIAKLLIAKFKQVTFRSLKSTDRSLKD